jgi:CubicO group peptidase (beta-lactamase class C family)
MSMEVLIRTAEGLQQQYGIPGMSVAVTLGRQIVFEQGFGVANQSSGMPMLPETLCPIGSITKAFVVTALMQLVEQGMMHLDDPVTLYLPEYDVNSPFQYGPPTTLRQLASHTAGLPRDAAINFPMNATMAPWITSSGATPLVWYAQTGDLLASLATVKLEIPPNSGKIYSNLGIALLGIAVERAAGQPLAEILADGVFGPLGMMSSQLVASHADLRPDLSSRMATGYIVANPGEVPLIAPPWELGSAMYSGGICATAGDLARFLAFFLAPSQGPPILSPDSSWRMCPPVSSGDLYLGWWKGFHGGYENYGHGGGHLGFLATTLGIPALQLGVTVLTNRFNPIAFENHATEIAQALLTAAVPLVTETPVSAPFDSPVTDLAAYAGLYTLDGGFYTAHVEVEEDYLVITFDGLSIAPLKGLPVGLHQPRVPDVPALSFSADAQGQIEKLSFALFTFTRRRS